MIHRTLWRAVTVLVAVSMIVPLAYAAPHAPLSTVVASQGTARQPLPQMKDAFVHQDTAIVKWDALPPDVQGKVDPRILAEFRGEAVPAHLDSSAAHIEMSQPSQKPQAQTRFLIHLRDQADLEEVVQQDLPLAERRQAVFDALVDTAETTQGGVKAQLDMQMSLGKVTSYQPFYIFNGLAVEGDLDAVIELAGRDDVARIVANYPLVPLWNSGQAASTASASSFLPDSGPTNDLSPDNWNIDLVDADRVWDEFDVNGAGAVVANIDTGVDWTHPALQPRYRGYSSSGSNHNYNWFDPDPTLYPDGDLGPSLTAGPFDYGAHGTHTMGTMVGDGGTPGTQVGLAPGAQWIAISLNELSIEGSTADDIMGFKAFQWMLCPTDLSGDLATADCSKAPDVVNNSWGSANPTDDTFRPAIRALRAGGVAPVFAAGNPSAGPGSIGSPGSAPEAITVGATDIDDVVASFSGRGPSFYEGEQKPELSAPGVSVKSTIPSGDYMYGDGTSMAAPHVAGLVALMVSADLEDGIRDSDVDELERFMEYTAVDLGTPGPDDDYGYGRIDAYDAVRWALSAGDLHGTVRDAISSALIEGASVTGVKTNPGDTFTAFTDSSGQYMTTVPAGTYNVTVEAWGHYSSTFTGQTVITGVSSIADFSLDPLPIATLSGEVLSGTTPISGALVAVAAQSSVSFRTGADGVYTLTLPVGTHEMVVEASGYRILHEDVSVAPGGSPHDFSMTPAPTILVVDADAYAGWFIGWPVRNFFHWALDQEGYLYSTYVLTDTTMPLPPLFGYDLVIWAHGGGVPGNPGYGGSPSQIAGAEALLMSYLDGGGRLIVSGQDIGYWDSGTTFYTDYLHAYLMADVAAGEGDAISGSGFLSGIDLEITNASLHGYQNGATFLSPDAVTPRDGAALPVLTYDNGNGIAALGISPCDKPYRAVYFAVGYENVGPRAGSHDPSIAETLDRSIVWVMDHRPTYGVNLSVTPSGQTSEPGTTAYYNVQVANAGLTTANFQLDLGGNTWPAILPITSTQNLPPCGMIYLSLEVDVPASAPIGSQDTVTVTVSRHPGGSPSESVAVTTKAFPSWRVETPMPTPRYRLAAAALPDGINYYAIGGWDDGYQPTDANERYDACTDQWETMAPLPQPLTNLGAAALDGKIYTVGGMDASYSYTATVYAYDPISDAWSSAADFPTPLTGGAVAAANGKLYVFGGVLENNEFSDKTYEYAPTSNTWTEKSPLPGGKRVYAAAAETDGKIYVVGGWPNLKTVEVYDPVTDSWSEVTSMNVGRQSPGLSAASDGYLYVSGGGSEWNGLSSAERYDPAADTWEIIPSLNDANRAGTASAYAAGRIFAVGGAGYTISDANESLRVGRSFCNSDKRSQQYIVQPGGHITYTVEIHAGAGDLTGASLVDPIPTGTTFAGFGVNTIGATYDSVERQVEWEGDIPGGSDPMKLTFGVDVTNSGWNAGDFVTNTATFDNGADLVFDRTASNQLVFPSPSPSIKQVDKDMALDGDVLTYTVRVENASYTGGVFGLHDSIPPNTTYVSGSLTYTLGSGQYDPALDAITWSGILPVGSLPPVPPPSLALGGGGGLPYAYVTFAVAVTSPLPVNTWITNTATITSSFQTVERSAGTLINPVVLGQSQKQVDKSQATPGTIVTYDLLLQNTGFLSAAGATLTDALPTEVTYVPSSLSCSSGSCVEASGVITWTGDVAPGDPVTVTFDAAVVSSLADQTPVTNTATLDNGFGDIDDLTATFLVLRPNLSRSYKQAVPATVEPGDMVTYTIFVRNSRPVAGMGEMRDELPVELTYVPGSLFCGSGSCNEAAGVITWTGTVPARSMVPVRFRATVPADYGPDSLANTAIVTDTLLGVSYPVTATVWVGYDLFKIYLPLAMRSAP
jgi:uncharacterized repeat protein (TIGR01451 family)